MTSLKLKLLLSSLMIFSSCGEEKAKTEQWENLLDTKDINTLWVGAVDRKGQPGKEVGKRWILEDGILSLDFNRKGKGGSIETKKSYDNFELKFEYNIQKKCNSGVKYRLKHSTGLEYQIIDDKDYKDNKIPSHRTGGMYEIKGPSKDKKLNPAGEWNTARIVADGNTLEHWLNGVKVVSIEFGSDEWDEQFEKSKHFEKKILDYATHKSPIHIQDHTDTIIEFKNMFIREL